MSRPDADRAFALLVLLGHLLDVVLLAGIAFFLFVKALTLHRRGELGLRLAQSNVALGVAFLGVLLATVLAFFRSEFWRDGIRLVLFLTLGLAARAMARSFGGWRATGREVQIMLREWWTQFLAAELRIQVVLVVGLILFVALIVLAQVGRWPGW